MHSAISGTVDFREPNDEACIARIRSIVEKWGYRRLSPWDRKKPVEPEFAEEEIYGIYDPSPGRPYDMKEVLARVLDGSRFDEYKPEYGKTLIFGTTEFDTAFTIFAPALIIPLHSASRPTMNPFTS